MNRIRQSGHIEGQFTSLVFVPINGKVTDILSKQRDNILHILNDFHQTHGCDSSSSNWEFIGNDQLHLSLSRTTFLKVYMLDPFLERLRESIHTPSDSCVYLCDTLRLYVNDEGNTAFVGVPIDKSISPVILDTIKVIDSVLSEFDQKTFYSNPDPHVSVAYTTDPHILRSFRSHSETELGSMNLSDAEIERFGLDIGTIHVQLGNQTHVV
jgi:hypothetical protein